MIVADTNLLAALLLPSECEFVALAVALEVPLVTSDQEILAAFPEVARSPRDHLVRGPA